MVESAYHNLFPKAGRELTILTEEVYLLVSRATISRAKSWAI